MHKLLVRVLKIERERERETEREGDGSGPIRMFTEGTNQIQSLLTN